MCLTVWKKLQEAQGGTTTAHWPMQDLAIRCPPWNMPEGRRLWSRGTGTTAVWYTSLKTAAPGTGRDSIPTASHIPAETACVCGCALPT